MSSSLSRRTTPRIPHHARLPRTNNGHSFNTLRPIILLLSRTLSAYAAPLLPIRLLEDEDPKDSSDPELYVYLSIAMVLVLLGGVFAGLTIALMGQDETYLQVIATSGEGSEKRHAEKVLDLLKKGKHWVLVTLLLSNVITNETLPIVLDRSLGGGWPAVLSSTVLIVIFGEIVPQSICVRYGLSIGAFMSTLVWLLMCLMLPIAWPTAKLLDYLLGEDHGTMYKKAGLKTLVTLHKSGIQPGGSGQERLNEDEVTIISGVLDLKEKSVGGIMTPMQDVFTMSVDTVLDERMMDTILSQGYSRIPIYAPDNNRNFIGMLLVKMLITYDPEDSLRVRDFSLATLPETSPLTSCLDIINFFQEGKSHMVLVSDWPGEARGAMGVLTLEDVIEELIGEEIVDESDVFEDVHKAIRRSHQAPRQRYKHGNLHPEQAKEVGEDEPLLSREQTKDSTYAGSGGPNGQQQQTFLMRRKSSTASADGPGARSRPVAVRSNTAGMKEHLKHLGPSNVAKHPRTTKFSSVKIKPGLDTIPQGQQPPTAATTEESEMGRLRSRSLDDQTAPQATISPPPPGGQTLSANIPPAPQATPVTDEEGRLLTSAGKDASGGAAALRAGYGTMGSSPKSPEPKAKELSAGEASKVAEENTSPDPPRRSDTLRVPGKMVVGDDGSGTVQDGSGGGDEAGEDTVGDMQAPSRDRSRTGTGFGGKERGVRSGSITETTVESGGMKKTVLETTSSSEEPEEEGGGEGVVNVDGNGREVKKGGKKKKGKRRK